MKMLILTTCLCVLFAANFVLADWDPGDSYKMHFPQLPDACGWDVYAGYIYWQSCSCGTKRGLADDWLCTESGAVTDIHFWGSWKSDIVGQTGNIAIGIFANDTTGDFNKPGELLWKRLFTNQDYQSRLYSTGDQGWFNPYTGCYKQHDHDNIYQYNITDIADPFYQEEGNIYWLEISMNFARCHWGWKTSLDHFGSDGVYLINFCDLLGQWQWQELRDPITCESLDLAFVITPEPATIVLLGLGSLVIIRRRK